MIWLFEPKQGSVVSAVKWMCGKQIRILKILKCTFGNPNLTLINSSILWFWRKVHVLHNEKYSMSVNIKPVTYNKRVSIMYQKSLPEGDVDLTRCFNSFRRQPKPHQELSTAEKQNGNLGRKREKIDLITHFTVNCVCISFSAWGPGWLCYPETSGFILDEAMQRFAGH